MIKVYLLRGIIGHGPVDTVTVDATGIMTGADLLEILRKPEWEGIKLALACEGKKLSAAEQKAKDWADQAIGTINLSEQSKDSLNAFWKDNSKQIGWIEANMAADYERLLSVFDQAIERAALRAA